MSVVVKLSGSRVTYVTGDSVWYDGEGGNVTLNVCANGDVIGVHAPHEWRYATVHTEDAPALLVRAALDIMEGRNE